jgi:hypothetical protein
MILKESPHVPWILHLMQAVMRRSLRKMEMTGMATLTSSDLRGDSIALFPFWRLDAKEGEEV